MPLMAKFEIDEFEERLTDNCVQQIEINTKKDTACLCISLIWTLYFNFFQGCGAYKLVVMLLQSSRKPSGPKTEATKIGWGLVKN